MSIQEQKGQWREKALGGHFFGEPIASLDRDGLLAVIGCLESRAEMERQLRANERETWRALSVRPPLDVFGPRLSDGIGKSTQR